MRPVLFGLLQLAGAVAAVVGLYLLLGLAWAMVIGGLGGLVAGIALEVTSLPAPVARERDRLRKVA